ncbi:MAG: hypothetical protein AABM29_10020 [Actinomycetota bacterium]
MTSPVPQLRRRELLIVALALPAPALAAGCGENESGESEPPRELAGPAPKLSPTPACGEGDEPTPAQTEGPFFIPDSPRRASLREPGVVGEPLLLTGVVLSTSCAPQAGALLEPAAEGGVLAVFHRSRAVPALLASLALSVSAMAGCGGSDEITETSGAEIGEAGSVETDETGAAETGDTGGSNAAATGGPKTLDTRALADSLNRFFVRLEPREPWRVKCPNTVRPAKGRQFKCTVAGERVVWNFIVIQRNSEGRVSYTGKPHYLREFPGLDPKIKITRTTTLDIEP